MPLYMQNLSLKLENVLPLVYWAWSQQWHPASKKSALNHLSPLRGNKLIPVDMEDGCYYGCV